MERYAADSEAGVGAVEALEETRGGAKAGVGGDVRAVPLQQARWEKREVGLDGVDRRRGSSSVDYHRVAPVDRDLRAV